MEAYIYDAIRTPRGATKNNGSLREMAPVHYVSQLFHALEARNELSLKEVNDIVLGCVTQIREQGGNIAKVAALFAGLPNTIPGMTVNRYCASGLDAVLIAAAKVKAGMDELVIAGGVESSSRVPMFSDEASWFSDPEVATKTNFIHMGLAADLMASLSGFTREDLDQYAFESHERAEHAYQQGFFDRSLIPVYDHDSKELLDKDELIRPDTTMEKLAALKPSFSEKHVRGMKSQIKLEFQHVEEISHLHHAGNSPTLADGASLILIGSKEKGKRLGLTPRARIVASTNVADHPFLLGGGQKAAEAVLKKAGLTIEDIDLFEFNEAFAATVIKFQRDFGLERDQLNPNGGVIAMGHALGATGGMLICTLLDELERRNQRRGLVAISGAAGVGTALIIERVV
ncbi:acetyl-CoA C-acetyltransferase [Neobacillus niacini]|uniref:acetyl-CoA C-acetyltransferase n=1 Tax=Neobacillus niacini TaxID=86668 RepID=UPI0021CB0E59|nr:acetyl-CoA C-acetyltransferase [Neobacillus niacini]MCM3763816.1 acetyl-CoA C-acetyltransferase [Neobacillus niacini]